MKSLRYLLFSGLMLGHLVLPAQQELPSGQIEVVKDFEVRLTETRKVRIIPAPVHFDTIQRRYEYVLQAPSPSISYQIPEIKPLAITAEEKPTAYPFYARAGYGSPNTVLGEISYDHVQNEFWYWGTDVRHRSANHKKVRLQQFSETEAAINTTYLISDKVRLDGQIQGLFQGVYFYGADPIPSNPEALKRNFNRFGVHLEASSIYSEETLLSYKAFMGIQADKDDLGSRESGMLLGGEVASALSGGEIPVGIRIRMDYSKLKHTEEYSLNNILAEPYLKYNLGRLRLHMSGMALLRQNANELLPRFEARFSLPGELLILRAGWTGDVQKNNFHALSLLNPFIHTRLDSINNRITRRLFAGIQGMSGELTFECNGGYTRFSGMAFFLQDEDQPEQFVPVYDNGSYVSIDGSVGFELLQQVSLFARFEQRFFKLDQENKPWHMPSWSMDAQVMYGGGQDPYHVSFLLHAENGLPYRTPGGTEARLNALVDLNLHADYYITESLGAFTEINNILNNKRERWANYPSIGFNMKAGILLRLP